MSNDPERHAGDKQADEEMARADRTNGERPTQEEHGPEQHSDCSDPEAPGDYVNDDRDASSVAEPNEPAAPISDPSVAVLLTGDGAGFERGEGFATSPACGATDGASKSCPGATRVATNSALGRNPKASSWRSTTTSTRSPSSTSCVGPHPRRSSGGALPFPATPLLFPPTLSRPSPSTVTPS